MSKVPKDSALTQEKEEEDVTPASTVTETKAEAAKPQKSTAIPSRTGKPKHPSLDAHEQPPRPYHAPHSAGPPHPPYHVVSEFSTHAASANGKQQPVRVVTSYLYYDDGGGQPEVLPGLPPRGFPSDPQFSRPNHTEASTPRGIPLGPPYPRSPPPVANETPLSIPRAPYGAQQPYPAPARGNYSGPPGGDLFYGDPRHNSGQTTSNFQRGEPIPPGHYTPREHQILGNLQRECIAHLFAEPTYKRWKTPENFPGYHAPPPPVPPRHYHHHHQTQGQYGHGYRHAQPHGAPSAPPGYPGSQIRATSGQRVRTAQDDRISAAELARRQAERPEVPEPVKQPALRRLFGSKRRNERRVKEEEARRHNYYY